MVHMGKNNLKEFRIRKNLSIPELARKAELSERYLRFIEAGDKTPSLQTAQKISSILESSIEDIFCS